MPNSVPSAADDEASGLGERRSYVAHSDLGGGALSFIDKARL